MVELINPLRLCTVLACSRVVLLGDLNYRIAMDDDEARQLVRARKWGMLLEGDELLLELSSGRQFHGWHEGHVTFAPTYKYRRNSDHLHWCADGVAAGREKQHRAPAWSDTDAQAQPARHIHASEMVSFSRCSPLLLFNYLQVRPHPLAREGDEAGPVRALRLLPALRSPPGQGFVPRRVRTGGWLSCRLACVL